MIYVDPTSFAAGVLAGVAGSAIIIGFAAMLAASVGADKRGLSGRHRPESAGATELSGSITSATGTVEPRGGTGGRGYHLVDVEATPPPERVKTRPVHRS